MITIRLFQLTLLQVIALGTLTGQTKAIHAATSAGQSGIGRNVALVIGNSSYTHAPISTAVNDGNAIASILSQHAFTVTLELNVGKRALATAIDTFVAGAGGADSAVFYFSGYAVEVDGEDYLIPTDAVLGDSIDLKVDGYALGRLQEKLQRANCTASIIILDACRGNRFSRTKSLDQSLGPLTLGRGSFIALSAGPGMINVDIPGPLSLFTSVLLKSLLRPGITIDDIFMAVRSEVSQETDGRQIPVQMSSLAGPFYFVPPTKDVQSAASLVSQGTRLLEAGTAKESVSYFDRALQLRKDYLPAFTNRGYAYRELGDEDHARQDFEQAIALRPFDVSDYLARGDAYRAQNRLERAIADFNECIQRDPSAADAYGRRGLSYEQLKESESAIRDLTQAIELGRRNTAVYKARASAYLNSGQMDAALSDLNFLVAQKPQVDIYLMRASIYTSLHQFVRAGDDISASIALTPSDAALYNRRAAILELLQNWGSAEADYRRVISLDPNNHAALNSLAYMFAERGENLKEALALIQRALELSPDNPFYWDTMGWVYYKLGKYGDAQPYLLRAAEALYVNAEIQEHVGDVALKQQQFAKALTYFTKATELLGATSDAAAISRLRSRIDEAKAELDRREQKKPKVGTARFHSPS